MCTLLLIASPAFGLSAAEIRSRGEALGAQVDRVLKAANPDAAQEQRLIGELGELVLGFIDESDRAAQQGREESAASALRPAFEAVHRPLDAMYSRRSGWMQGRVKAIMEEDGDLEALYDSPQWQESQTVAAQALYYLNWLNFYGARVVGKERREKLLEAAERGFSEFAVGEKHNDLLVESLLGRALCHLELGNYDWAIRDFRSVVDEKSTSPERREKARLGLLEAYLRGKKIDDALRYSNELLRSSDVSAADKTVVRFYRLEALFDAIQASPREADARRREAGALMDVLRRAGSGWAAKVDALMATRVDDPKQWVGKADTPQAEWELARMLLERGDEATAAPLLADVVASDRADAKPLRPEASYWLGVARFKSGEYAEAADAFDTALAGEQPAERAANAFYLRFKALEALMAAQAAPPLAERYEAAIRDLLEKDPDNEHAYEARYRLGELLQSRGEFQPAIDEYERVGGDPGFELRARYGTLQSEFELLRAADAPSERAARLDAVGKSIDAFWAAVESVRAKKEKVDVPVQDFAATATLLQAVYLTQRPDGDQAIVDLLAGYDQRYPEHPELLPQAVRLRLAALRESGDFAEAEREVTKHAEALRTEGRTEALDALAQSFARAAAKARPDQSEPSRQAARRVALALYDAAGAGEDDDRRELTIAHLNESTGDVAAAAAIYEKLLAANGSSLSALSGLARIAEKRQDLAGAADYWKRYAATARPGDAPWYRGQYEQARLTLARGDADASCAMLKNLRPAMPGLSDQGLRGQLDELYERACG